MKKSKKIISIVLAIALVVSISATIFIVTANAKETSVTITVDKEQLSAGETATVSVNVTANYAIATMSIPVFYDKTLVTVSDATATLTDYSVASATTDVQSVDSDKIYTNTDVSAEKFGFVLATYIGGADAEVPETMDNTVLTFTITAKADVSGAAAIKCDSDSAKTDENVAGMLYFGSPTSGRIINSIPENIEKIDLTQAGTSVIIGNIEPELAVSEYGKSMGVVVDKISYNMNGNGFVYGINTDWGEMIESYFETPAGSVVVTPNAMGVYSTGTVIELMDDAGSVIETYNFVFLGDVNGDGFVDAVDVSMVDGIANYVDFDYFGDDGTSESMSMDINGDGFIDAVDVSIIDGIANYMDFPTQAEWAAEVAAMKGI